MKPILRAKVLNAYRSNKPKGFYNPIKRHTGVDLLYNYENLPSPITGIVVAISRDSTKQPEMGNVLYIEDALGSIHVFAHLDKVDVGLGNKVERNQIVALTGNSGSRTTSPHLHWEILTAKPINFIDKIMSRKLSIFKGYSTDPIVYLKTLYFKYKIDMDGNPVTSI